MPGIAIDTDVVDVGAEWGGTAEVTASQSIVTFNGVPVVIQGDAVEDHYDYGAFGVVVGSHTGVTMTSTQSHVTINGTPIVVNGDPANCDPAHVIIGTGSTVTIS